MEQPFDNLYQLTDGTIPPGNPDRYYGSPPEHLDPDVLEKLGDYIAPTTESELPIAPNFFLHVTGPYRAPEVAQVQALYDGALGARGIHNLRLYTSPNEAIYDNKAYTITATYLDGMLKFYAVHPTYSSVTHRTEFIMTPLRAISLHDDLDSLREGVAVYRNALEWAQSQRHALIVHANLRTRRQTNKAAYQANARAQDPAPSTVDDSGSSIQNIAFLSIQDNNDKHLIKSLKPSEGLGVSDPDDAADNWELLDL